MGEPDWIAVLRKEAERTSQAQVAKRLRLSQGVVNQVLNGKYPAKTDNVESRVRGEFMRQTVDCPVLEEISTRACLDNQRRPWAATNPQRVQLYLACRKCEHATLFSNGEAQQ